MRLNISAWAIRQPMPSIVMFVVLCLMGLFAFRTLPITKFPNIDVPVVSVTITQSGAAPSELETQVTKRVEDALAGITGVKNMISTINDGSSVTAVEFRLEVNTDRALNDVKDAIAKIRADLPRNIDEPVVQRIEVEGQPIVTYAVAAPARTLEELSWHVDDVVKRELQGAKGVGRVSRIGGVNREIKITLDPDRLSSLGITAGEVNRQLRATSVDLAGGRSEIGGIEQSIRTLASSRTLDELAATRIVIAGKREVRLGDLGTVTDSIEEPRSFARLDGSTPVVAASIYRSKGASEYDVKTVVEKRMADLSKRNPGFTYTIIDDAAAYTYGNYKAAMATLVEGALLAVIVVLIFLRDWRATVITAIALPLSIIPTFWALDALGFSLNLVSLLAITLATGILVDDAIVEIENIVRHMRMGKSPYRAALEAADEIGLAVIAITFTIVAVFAPVSFMGGIAGQYFKQFGLTVAVAVLFSLLVARLITPMMAAYFMRPHPHVEARDGRLMRAYTRLLAATIRHPWLTMACGIGIFAASIWSVGLLPTGFIPPEDSARIVMAMELPPGSRLEDVRSKTDEVARSVRQIPEVDRVYVVGGSSPTGNLETRKSALYVKLVHKSQRSRKQKEIEREVSRRLADIPDLRAWYVNERGERELALTLASQDAAALDTVVAKLEAQMRQQPGFINVAAVAGIERPEIRVSPRFDESARLGVTTEQISEALRIATIGDVGPALARFSLPDRQIPIRVLFDESARGNQQRVESMTVLGSNGIAVPLTAVADITFGQGASSIERFNRERRVVVGTDLVGITTGQGAEIIESMPAITSMPASVRLLKTGDAEIQDEVFSGFARAMGLGIVLVLGVLVLLFGSVFLPITILLSLPLSIGGVIVALLVTHNPISMPVVIGILMLMGIVTKNAIMLVDFAIEEVARGVPKTEAIIDAGRKRARPIIMTTIAMAAGMLPSAYGVGDGGEFRAPMAIGVIGGLIASTMLSLVFVPSFYVIMDNFSQFMTRVFGRFVGPTDEPEEARPPGSAPAGQAAPHAGPAVEWPMPTIDTDPLPATTRRVAAE
jgi:hydrophobic/amphiphilic exporter-1 (mainly G- bacteria), HAE1 family